MVECTIILIFILNFFILLSKEDEIKYQNSFNRPFSSLIINKRFKTTINVPTFIYSINETIQNRVYQLYNTKGVQYLSKLKLPKEIVDLGEILKNNSFEFFILTKLETYENRNTSIKEKKKIKNDIKKAVYYAKKIMNTKEYKKSIQYFKEGEKEFSELDFIYMEGVLGIDVMYNIASNVHMRYPREIYLLCGENIGERDICRSLFNYLDNF
uniref:Uncharacterized protein n=1 Tax=Strongyloides stercoralis TaxID=6248 RepID=A0A0K0DT38_STRER